MFKTINPSVSVAPQLTTADVADAGAQGFALIINNRPDGEEPGQPSGAVIEAAAKAAGIDYVHIPLAPGGLTRDMIVAVRRALDAAKGKTLMYCRSGTRSTTLWGLAEASAGADPDGLAATAAAAGYDLSPVAGLMRQLAAEA